MSMAGRMQSYKSHTRWLPAFHFFVMPVLLLNFLNTARHLVRDQTAGAAFSVLVAAAFVALGLLSRLQALAAQDRVIRLEMRLKLRGVLPTDMHGRINDLSTSQLVAM